MKRYWIEDTAAEQIEDIYIHSTDTWGELQAEAYIHGLYEMFDDILTRRVVWRSVPATFPVEGYVRRYRSHFVYWRERQDGEIGIVAVLHERMHQSNRLERLFRDEP